MESAIDSQMNARSSSSGTSLDAVPQTMAKLMGPPYRKRPRDAVLNDTSLEQIMGTKEKALDVRHRTHWYDQG